MVVALQLEVVVVVVEEVGRPPACSMVARRLLGTSAVCAASRSQVARCGPNLMRSAASPNCTSSEHVVTPSEERVEYSDT